MNERQARLIVRRRASNACEICRHPATNFAHRKNRSQGGQWAPSNGLLLCGSGTTGCHGWTTSHPAYAEQAGWRVLSTGNPAEAFVWVNTYLGCGWVLLDDAGGLTMTDRFYDAAPQHMPPPRHGI